MKLFFGAAALFFTSYIFAQSTANNLHYKYTESSYNRKKELVEKTHEYNFNLDATGNVLVMDKIKEDKVFPQQIVDKDRKISVVVMANRKDYILEELDSAITLTLKLEPTTETKIIGGFNCKNYKATSSVSFTGGIYVPTVNYEFSLWVTNDVVWNEAFNPFIFAALKTEHSATSADFKGLLVELDTKVIMGEKTWTTTTILDATKLNAPPATVSWPWNTADNVAWLQLYIGSSGTILIPQGYMEGKTRGTICRVGDGSSKDQFNRMKALLVKTTGTDNPKFKQQIITDCYW